MIKIAYTNGSTINFIDSNNRFIGYELGQQCCEDADWAVLTKAEADKFFDTIGFAKPRTDGADSREVFNGEVFKEANFDGAAFVKERTDDSKYGCYTIRFPLVMPEGRPQDLCLMLYNLQNGYYSHGFSYGQMGKRGKPLKGRYWEDSL
jgi:hypothetical protein